MTNHLQYIITLLFGNARPVLYYWGGMNLRVNKILNYLINFLGTKSLKGYHRPQQQSKHLWSCYFYSTFCVGIDHGFVIILRH